MRHPVPMSAALLATLWLAAAPAARAQGMDALTAHALDVAAEKLSASVAALTDHTRYPRSARTTGGWLLEGPTSWTSGFFPGCLWLMYEHTGDAAWSQAAAAWTANLEAQKLDTSTHDIGFQILCSFGNGHRLTGNPAYADVVRRGAQSLAARFDPEVGCTRSWDNHTFPVIVDNLMNLELLFQGSGLGGEAAWRDMAWSHALRSRQEHVRADGSTFHLVDFHPASGAVLSRKTVQGYADGSTWARGQAWAIYGFTMAYRETRDASLLQAAQQAAEFFLDHLPFDAIPFWDFDAPAIPNEPRDTSAAAIAAAGLLELSDLAPDQTKRARYRAGGAAILGALCSPGYLNEGSGSPAILLHGVGHRPANWEVDVSLIYADYYFLQSLLRWRTLATAVVPNSAREAFAALRLEPAAPNPFNPRTQVTFQLAAAGTVRVQLFDARGGLVRTLADRQFPGGRHALEWNGQRADGTAAASGIYYCRIQAGAAKQTSRITLVR